MESIEKKTYSAEEANLEVKLDTSKEHDENPISEWTSEDFERINNELQETSKNLETDKEALTTVRAELGSSITGVAEAPAIDRSEERVHLLEQESDIVAKHIQSKPEQSDNVDSHPVLLEEKREGASDTISQDAQELAGPQAQAISQDTEQVMVHNEISADMIGAKIASVEAFHKSGLGDGLKAYLRMLGERDEKGYIPLAGSDSLRDLYRSAQELESAIESPQTSMVDLRKRVKNLTQTVRESINSIPQNRSGSRDDPESLSASWRSIGQLRDSVKELTSRLYTFDTNDEIKEIRTSLSNLESYLDGQADYARRLYKAVENYRNGPRY